jgi:hypothetical protein
MIRAARRWTLYHKGLTATGGSILAGLGMLVVGLPVLLPLILFIAFVNGAGLEAFSLIWVNTLQEMVPPEKLGRVSSIDWLGCGAVGRGHCVRDRRRGDNGVVGAGASASQGERVGVKSQVRKSVLQRRRRICSGPSPCFLQGIFRPTT